MYPAVLYVFLRQLQKHHFTMLNLFYFRHYPQIRHTAVAETPENRRIAENTKIQSNVCNTISFPVTCVLKNSVRQKISCASGGRAKRISVSTVLFFPKIL